MSLLALKDLFARHRTRATGLWRLGDEPHRMVYLESGDIVFATSTHPMDRLTHLLVERGKLTQAQLDYAMANLNPAMSIGKNLIEMGFITQRDLLDVARAQVERVVWSVIAGTEAAPRFEARDLDATTVRLPFDTAALLLSGVLNLKDRERVLEELGPLNQVVVLEGRRHQELNLPTDLARVLGLLDGSRTLMELGREVGVEPFRLGAFVLFLREMGWARLHELPPLDRGALERALDPAELPLSPLLPEVPAVAAPSLFAEIHASQHPTTNLEHLSEALDQLGPEDELPDPAPSTPASSGAAEPALTIHHQAEGSTIPAEPPRPAPSPRPQLTRRLWPLALVPLLALALWGGAKWLRRFLSRRTVPAPVAQAAPVAAPEGQATAATAPEHKPVPSPPGAQPPAQTVPAPPAEAQPVQAKPTPTQPTPTPKPAPAVTATREVRLETILKGDWTRALAQGTAHRRSLDARWTLRLEIACQGGTVQHAAELLKDRKPDLFLVPMTMRDGRTCYQVFMGAYTSEAAAKDAARHLPPPFLTEGNRPKPFRVSQIPDRQ